MRLRSLNEILWPIMGVGLLILGLTIQEWRQGEALMLDRHRVIMGSIPHLDTVSRATDPEAFFLSVGITALIGLFVLGAAVLRR